jgi:hypothetical protein
MGVLFALSYDGAAGGWHSFASLASASRGPGRTGTNLMQWPPGAVIFHGLTHLFDRVRFREYNVVITGPTLQPNHPLWLILLHPYRVSDAQARFAYLSIRWSQPGMRRDSPLRSHCWDAGIASDGWNPGASVRSR